MYLRRRGFAEAVPVVRVCIAFFFILDILFSIPYSTRHVHSSLAKYRRAQKEKRIHNEREPNTLVRGAEAYSTLSPSLRSYVYSAPVSPPAYYK